MPNKTGSTARTYAIVYGLAEGPFISRSLRHAMEAAGFMPAKAHEADVVITHSGGCYTVPANSRAKLFLHINPPYWPGKPIVESVRQKVAYNFRLRKQRHQLQSWALSSAANSIYALNLKRAFSMIMPYNRARQTLARLPDSLHVFIRTHIDNYCDPAALISATSSKHSYLTLAGHHDDCWREPEQYVQLVKALYANPLK